MTLRICHFLSVAQTLDARSFFLLSVPLVERGAEVMFIGPHGRNCVEHGVQLISSPVHKRRLMRILSTPLLLPKLVRAKADIYQFSSPELIPVALLLKLMFRKRVVYDLVEDYPTMMLNKQYLPEPLRAFFSGLVTFAESLCAKRLDGVISADARTLRRLARIGNSRKIVFLNLPNLKFFRPPVACDKPFDFIYRGGLSERTGLGVLLEAIRILIKRGRHPRLLLVGYADDQKAFAAVKEAIHNGIPEGVVELRGTIPHEEMAATLAAAKVGLSPLRPIPKFLLNIPVKVWEYWASGIATIATNLPPIRPFFRDGEYGILVPPDDAVVFADALEWTLDHPSQIEEMGRAARQAVCERLNNSGEVKRLMAFYAQLIGASA
jgi:glycosyltransferase involved in cell wall biosynthesis